jgi:hypothetical protein
MAGQARRGLNRHSRGGIYPVSQGRAGAGFILLGSCLPLRLPAVNRHVCRSSRAQCSVTARRWFRDDGRSRTRRISRPARGSRTDRRTGRSIPGRPIGRGCCGRQRRWWTENYTMEVRRASRWYSFYGGAAGFREPLAPWRIACRLSGDMAGGRLLDSRRRVSCGPNMNSRAAAPRCHKCSIGSAE